MRRMLAISLAALLMTASVARAADDDGKTLAPSLSLAGEAAARGAELRAVDFTPREPAATRPAALPALYVSTALLQGYDAYSTLSAVQQGGVEQNPLMRGVVKNPAAFVALKAGIATASIMAAEQMWKRHNRTGAILTMVASNSLMAIVAAHNARVLGQMH